ncbi:UNVERIFIED_CONTAM: hypothetical protein Sangu_3226100 [Sesamum angustifolium]|uniref:Uncharacterized protein n=1 Tax=Sesamum angustifolium TaxID=2727405 RepID=A0AAW2JI52_9LAMI
MNTKQSCIACPTKRWYLQYFRSSFCSASWGHFISGRSIRLASNKSSNIPGTSESRNGYSLTCISFKVSYLCGLSQGTLFLGATLSFAVLLSLNGSTFTAINSLLGAFEKGLPLSSFLLSPCFCKAPRQVALQAHLLSYSTPYHVLEWPILQRIWARFLGGYSEVPMHYLNTHLDGRGFR